MAPKSVPIVIAKLALGKFALIYRQFCFYVEAQRRVKSCTDQPCQWIMPSSVDAIPFSRIRDLDFSTPKSILLPTKRGAHLNNNCAMICDPTEIESQHNIRQASNHDSSSTYGFACNPNMIDTSEEHKLRFFNRMAKHSPCCLSLIPSFCEAYTTKQTIPSLPPPLPASYDPRNEELTYRELLNVAENFEFNLTLKHISDVEQATKTQSKCDA